MPGNGVCSTTPSWRSLLTSALWQLISVTTPVVKENSTLARITDSWWQVVDGVCFSILSAAVEDLGRSFATRRTDGLQQTTGGLKKIYLQKMCHILKKKFTMNLYNFWLLIMFRHQYLDTIMANCKVSGLTMAKTGFTSDTLKRRIMFLLHLARTASCIISDWHYLLHMQMNGWMIICIKLALWGQHK